MLNKKSIKRIKDWLTPDNDVVEGVISFLFWGIIIFVFIFIIMNYLDSTSTYQDCVPNYMGGCD